MSKPLEWVGSSYKDLVALPEDVQDTFGYALDLAQRELKHDGAKSFTQVGGGVMEVVEDYDGNAYRAMYTAKLPNAVYVLHCFQKKSKSGKATPRKDVGLIELRLKAAQDHSKQVMSQKVSRKPR
jgi:phage-related protein